ncbi:MAG: hypothetical protein HC832_02090 [Leptolyngbyaceae cyanobacterium RM1_405_57]|nr:hypothetical protein [Leptolyngbyaceae cyanobacterium RM1_405_57]
MNRNPGYQQHWQVNVVLIIALTAISIDEGRFNPPKLILLIPNSEFRLG